MILWFNTSMNYKNIDSAQYVNMYKYISSQFMQINRTFFRRIILQLITFQPLTLLFVLFHHHTFFTVPSSQFSSSIILAKSLKIYRMQMSAVTSNMCMFVVFNCRPIQHHQSCLNFFLPFHAQAV